MLSTLEQLFSTSPYAFAIFGGVLGLLVGSFLNVVIYRLPIMMERQWRQYCAEILEDDAHCPPANEHLNLSLPRSHCPSCKRQVRVLENIPVVSWLLLRGKCAGCEEKISVRYPLVELLSGILSVVVTLHFGFGAAAFAALLMTWALIALAFIDYDTQLLPDSITLPLIWVGLLISLGSVFVSPEQSIIGAVAGYLSLWSVYYLFKLLTGKEGMGFGDFKLLAALGAWLGWKLLPVIILLSSLAGAVLGLLLIAVGQLNRDKPIPFGPYLAIAGWCAMLWGEQIIDLYFSVSGL